MTGAPPKPEQAGFYPEDAKKEEVEKWIAALPEEQQAQAKAFFTVLRREADGRGFRIVSYNIEYQSELLRAARLLREAAELATEPTLQRYLDHARGIVSDQRLLPERCGLDGIERSDRADDRALRSL